MKHAIETKVVVGVALVLGAGMALGAPAFSQQTNETTRDRGIVVDLSDDIVEVPTLEVSWGATPIADPANVASRGGVIRDFVAPAHGGPSPFSGPVRDAGTIVVELEGSSELELSLGVTRLEDPRTASKPAKNSYHLKLAGGEPLSEAAVFVSQALPKAGPQGFFAGAQAIRGTFGMDGTFVVELPDDVLRHHSFYAGGMSLGGDASGRQILVPAKSKIVRVSGVDGEASAEVVFESEENEVSYDSKPIADAARTILDKTPVGTLSKARFYGHAAFAGLNDIVDVTVELGQEKKGSFVLRLSDDLAERNGLVSLEAEGGGHLMRFSSAEELSKAFADLALVDTFSGKLDVSLSWSRLATDGARAGAKQAIGRQAYKGGWQGGPGPRPAQGLGKLARHSGPESKAARTVELEEPAAMTVTTDVMGITGEPRTAKKPSSKKKSFARNTDEIQDGGNVTANLAQGPKAGWMGNATLDEVEREVELATGSLGNCLREQRELESASRTIELKRASLKKSLVRANGV